MKPNFLRLIYTYHRIGLTGGEIQNKAREAGYTMYTFNGIVYSINGDELFQLSDLLTDY